MADNCKVIATRNPEKRVGFRAKSGSATVSTPVGCSRAGTTWSVEVRVVPQGGSRKSTPV